MHFKEKFTNCVHKQINKQDCPRTMTRLIKRKLLVILKVRKLFIYHAMLYLIFIDVDVRTLRVIENFIIKGKMTATVLKFLMTSQMASRVASRINDPIDVLHGVPNGSQLAHRMASKMVSRTVF